MRNPWPVAVSFTSQLIVVGIMLTVPMLHIAPIKWAPPLILYTPPVTAPTPPRVEARGAGSQPAASLLRAVFHPQINSPRHIPTQISLVGEEPPPVGIGLNTADAGTSPLSNMGSTISPAPPLKAPADVAPPKPKPTIVRTSTGVQQALLIYQVKPQYPALARSAHVAGIVRLAAVIARDGSIQNLQVLSGHPLLVKAAIDAVREWRYKPTLLSGDAVEVMTEIDVNFTLSN